MSLPPLPQTYSMLYTPSDGYGDDHLTSWDGWDDEQMRAYAEAAAELAAEMTSRCKEVDYSWRAPEAERYCATIWANSISDYISAAGPTPWQAVQAVFAKRESLS